MNWLILVNLIWVKMVNLVILENLVNMRILLNLMILVILVILVNLVVLVNLAMFNVSIKSSCQELSENILFVWFKNVVLAVIVWVQWVWLVREGDG